MSPYEPGLAGLHTDKKPEKMGLCEAKVAGGGTMVDGGQTERVAESETMRRRVGRVASHVTYAT